MAFTETDFFNFLKPLIGDYPLADGRIELIPIGSLKVDSQGSFWERGNPHFPEGACLGLQGANTSKTTNVLGEITRKYQNSYFILVRRYTQIESQRTDLALFVENLRDWINLQDDLRGTPNQNPLLPTFGDNPKDEGIECQGGTQVGANEGGTDDYILTLNIRYSVNIR
jgi:hypothetical protein